MLNQQSRYPCLHNFTILRSILLGLCPKRSSQFHRLNCQTRQITTTVLLVTIKVFRTKVWTVICFMDYKRSDIPCNSEMGFEVDCAKPNAFGNAADKQTTYKTYLAVSSVLKGSHRYQRQDACSSKYDLEGFYTPRQDKMCSHFTVFTATQ